ncbi:unnamed protein product (macronuclear) [Paramecium tetraurelia]|uniref:Cyclic nucleotide-binding domain-containing protein n=1 Tax=Paramecium tetraurelia TaxID=5888 RepID=A0CBN9_PARTE|nr:uncharacterized protein GSPATT00036989001 [Paramecium tetraurelia]CAK68206.1 unnamed protein product [Paramecium tetraurelia]|eukprot:XP_001435603.1 hypothetical protein (macronuclear) [Paramecium tetraurelia strain d4-2]
MFESSVDSEFKGPIPPLLSSRVGFQEGDLQQYSLSSFHQQIPMSLVRQKTFGVKKSENQSAYENEEIQYGSKPQFLKTIIAKSLQNNFINNLWNRSYLRKLNQLSFFQIQQLDDLQMVSEGNEYSKASQLWIMVDVFTPYSKFIACWDAFQIITYLLIFFWLPYKISFEIYHISELFSETKSGTIEYLLMMILALDIGVGMNLAFIEKGQIIKDRKRIIQLYVYIYAVSFFTVTVQFFVPSLSSKDYTMILIQSILCVVFYILRITKINKILAQIQEYITNILFRFFNLSGYLNDLVGLLKVLMVIVSVVHICGCLWHGIAYYNSSFSWLDAYNLRDKSNASQYNVAIYWATMTMTTVGYGDITAKNDLELLINNLTMFIGSIVFAYSVNSIGIFVSNMYKGTMEYNRTVSLINTYMSKNKIQFELQTKVRSYLEYIWQEEQEMNDDEVGSIVNKLSKHLQDELQYQLRGNILKNCKIIMKLFSESFIKSLLHYMEEQAYSPEERIITINELDDCSLYVITKGEVELIFEANQVKERVKRNTFQNYNQFDCFGELAFFTGNSRTATAISKGFTRVFKISRAKFLNVISSYPDDYERFCEIRDRIINGDYGALSLNCFSCQSNSHLIQNCNYLHFCADKEKIIKKEFYPVNQRRSQRYSRRDMGKYNAWTNFQLNSTRGQDFQNDAYAKGYDDGDSHTLQMNDAYEDEEVLMEQGRFRHDFQLKIMKIVYLVQLSKMLMMTTVKTQPSITIENPIYLNQLCKPQVLEGVQPKIVTIISLYIAYKDDLLNSKNLSETQDQFVLPHTKPQLTLIQQNNPRPSLALPQPQLKKQLSRSASNEDHNHQPHRLSIDQKLIMVAPQKSDMDIKNLANNPRVQMKRTTTNNNQTLFTENNTQNNQHMSTQTIAPMLPGFDKMHIFLIYQPLHNYDMVIKRYAKVQRFFGKKRLYPEYSVYSFFFMAIKKGWKLRRLGETSKNAKSPMMMRSLRKIQKPYQGIQKQRSNFFKEVN